MTTEQLRALVAKLDATDTEARERAALLVERLRATLAGYVFRCRDEADLQDQICALPFPAGVRVVRELRVGRSRFDVMLESNGAVVVLELKVKGSAAAVERQAQRYAQLVMPLAASAEAEATPVEAVVVVTTSQRLAAALMAPGDLGQSPSPRLGGKPFHVIAVRTS